MMRWLRLWLCLWFIVSSWPAWAVTRDTSTSGTATAPSTSALTVSHTVTSSGGNRAIFILCAHRSKTATLTATYAGDSLDVVRTDINSGSTLNETWIFRKVAPQTGTNNWVVSSNENVSLGCYALSATDVDQTTPISDQDGVCAQLGTSASVTMTSATSELIIDVLGRSSVSQALAQGADQTDEIAPPVETSTNLTTGGSRQDGNSDGVMSWSWSTTGGNCLSAITIGHSAYVPDTGGGEPIWFQ